MDISNQIAVVPNNVQLPMIQLKLASRDIKQTEPQQQTTEINPNIKKRCGIKCKNCIINAEKTC